LANQLWKDGIKVSAVFTGAVLTSFLRKPLHELSQEFHEPEEVAVGKALVTEITIRPRDIPFST